MSFVFFRMVLVCASANTATGEAESIERRREGVQSANNPSQLMTHRTFEDSTNRPPASRPRMQVQHEFADTEERLLTSEKRRVSALQGVSGPERRELGDLGDVILSSSARTNATGGCGSRNASKASRPSRSSSRSAPEEQAAELQKEEEQLRKQREKLQEAPKEPGISVYCARAD